MSKNTKITDVFPKLKLSEKLIDGEIRDKDILSSLSEKDIIELLSNENKD